MTGPALSQPSLWTVLTPKWRGVLVRVQHERTASRTKFLLLATVGIAFWTAVFGVAYRVLRYMRASRTSATCSPPRCSASSCSRFSRS